MSVPSFTIHTLLDEASLSQSPRNITVSVAPASTLICRASTAPSRLVLLMWAFCQRKSSAVTQATPLARTASATGGRGFTIANTVGRRPRTITWSRGATPRETWK
ncbi:hypothetical protein D3C78_1740620 [compost metagenome]